jgi:hypothetical protein
MLETPHSHLIINDPVSRLAFLVCWFVFTIAWAIGFWIVTGAIKNARQSGHRYWLINPLAKLAGYRKMNGKLLLWSIAVGLAAITTAIAIGFFAGEPA